MWFHIWFIMTCYYKMRQILLRNATTILLQNATKVYKMRQVLLNNTTVLLQNAIVIVKCNDFNTKCDSYYNVQRLLQNTSIHAVMIQYL